MEAVVLPEYNTNIVRALRSMSVKNIDIPTPGLSQVLVQMEASPCNPSDIAFMRGRYNIVKKLPVTMGFEACGKVVGVGSKDHWAHLLGHMVCCFVQENRDGTWAEYFLADANNCIPVREEIPMEQAACMFVNPLTAYAMIKKAKEMKAKAILQNAAAGQIGNFIRVMAANASMDVINIVRKPEHVLSLRARNHKYVLDQNEENFCELLKKMAEDLFATVAFDAIGGELTGKICNAMPHGSSVFLYGGLAGQTVSDIDVMGLIFQGKTLTGFNVIDWMQEVGFHGFKAASDEIQEMIVSGAILTQIQGKYQLKDAMEGVRAYISNMSGGKILLVPAKSN